jgi:GMP synthase (glutamine-hydrolysing)
MKAQKIVIIKTGETFPSIIPQLGDFEDWIAAGLGLEDIGVVDVEKGKPLPSLDAIKGVVISGSHCMVTQNLDWSRKLEAWIPKLIRENIPLLGICYGHQLIAKAMGGAVDYHPGGIEIGTTQIELGNNGDKDLLFQNLPTRFKVHAFHSQTVIDLPESAVVIAKNEFEPHHAFRIGKCAWGVQFHPEADIRVLGAYIENLTQPILDSGQDPAILLDRMEETPVSFGLLKRFGILARELTIHSREN